MDVNQYLGIFLDETKEHLENLNTQILNLEQSPEDADTINEIFRAAHSLKGMAGTMGFKRMQTLTHDMENVFSEIRNGTMKATSNLIDILFQCLDALEEYTNTIQETSDEGTNDNKPLIDQLNAFLNGDKAAPAAEQKENGAGEKEASAAEGKRWTQIQLGEPEKHVITIATEQGKQAYGLDIKIQENCILKSARAFLVYKAVEERADIIVCNPSAQDIEDEKFEFEFSLIIVSDQTLDDILQAASSVSEIEAVTGDVLNLEESSSAPAASEEESSAKQEETKPAVTAAPAQGAAAKGGAPAKAGEKKPGKPVVNRTVRVDIEKLDVLMNLVSELIIAKNSLVMASTTESASGSEFHEHIEYLESVTTNLHESVMKVRMVPIESVVSKFPRMIRELSKKLDKKMELYMSGEETELDRTVVDEIGDPLMHLLRNSADHGL